MSNECKELVTQENRNKEPPHITRQRKFIRGLLVFLVVFSVTFSFSLGPVQDGEDFQSTRLIHNPPYDSITCMELDDGWDVVFVGTTAAIWIYDINSNQIVKTFQALNDSLITGVYDLAIWGSWTFRVYLATYKGLKAYNYDDGMIFDVAWASENADDQIQAVEIHPTRNLVAYSAWPKGLNIYNRDNSSMTHVNSTTGLVADGVTCLDMKVDQIAVGTNARGFSMYNLTDGSILNQNTNPDGYYFEVRCIEYFPAEKKVFVGTEEGLYIYELREGRLEYVRTIGHVDGLAGPMIYSMALDVQNHRMYLGTNGGLSYYDYQDDTVGTFEQTTELYRPFIESISVHNYGRSNYLYAGTFDGDFVKLKVDFTALNIENGYEYRNTVSLLFTIAFLGFLLGIPIVWKWFNFGEHSVSVGPDDELGAYHIVAKLMNDECEAFIWIVDTNVSIDTLPLLREAPRIPMRLLLGHIRQGTERFENQVKRFHRDRNEFEARQFEALWTHQRYLLTESKGWDIGSSLHRIGAKQTRIQQLSSKDYRDVVHKYKKDWSKAKKLA